MGSKTSGTNLNQSPRPTTQVTVENIPPNESVPPVAASPVSVSKPIPDPASVPLAGGFKIEETVYSLKRCEDPSNPLWSVSIGLRGTVKGPATDDDETQLLVAFEGKAGKWNMYPRSLSRVPPKAKPSTNK